MVFQKQKGVKMKKLELYPIWIRIWHILQGILFLLLLISGVGMHFGLVPISTSLPIHIYSGITMSVLYILFFVMNFATGNAKHYFKIQKGIVKKFFAELKYYFWNIFIQQELAYDPSVNKFGVFKQLLYLKIMYVVIPCIIITGLIILIPNLMPETIFGTSDVWFITLIHTIMGFFLTAFFLLHLYLGTTGKTVGQFYKAIATGSLEYEEKMPEQELPSDLVKQKKFFPTSFYNPLTMLGSLLALMAFVVIIGLLFVDIIAGFDNPYIGIVTFIFLPAILGVGIVLIFLGALWESKKRFLAQKKEKPLPIIDLNSPQTQRIIAFMSIIGVILLLFTVFGSFKAYEYTESDEFCGEACHQVMHPEYLAYQDSPHSNVGCVKCHIGSGADWFVKAKLSGSWQLISVMFDLYSKPIQVPVAHLRPAQETCEQCHWPSNFNSEKKIVYDFFQSDEDNTETMLTMLVKTGGGTPESGSQSGIHWHMNIANEIHYIANDYERQDIPWVRVVSKLTGDTTIYIREGDDISQDMLKPDNLRKMDCIDCHNRPSHIYKIPYKEVNTYMSNNKIDNSLPFIKNLAVQILESYSINRDNSLAEISNYINNFYNKYYPETSKAKKNQIQQSIHHINTIYLRNYFPEMHTNWKRFPNNLGHMYSDGCFRCHDGKHKSADGKVVSHDCNVCHTIISQKAPGQIEEKRGLDLEFRHPGGENLNIENRLCSDCHGIKQVKNIQAFKK